jgi:hypothetical protein
VETWEGEHMPIIGTDRLLGDLERLKCRLIHDPEGTREIDRLITELTRHREALKKLAGGNGYAPRL